MSFELMEFMQDHMRRAGDVCFSQVFRDGSGRRHWNSLCL